MEEFAMAHAWQILAATCIALAIFGFSLLRSSSVREAAYEEIDPAGEDMNVEWLPQQDLLYYWRRDVRSDMDLDKLLEKWHPARQQLRALREEERKAKKAEQEIQRRVDDQRKRC